LIIARGRAMPASVGYLVIDATDPDRLARFWCGLLDVSVDATIGDGQFVVLSATRSGLTVGFQRVPEAKAGKNRLHLDLVVGDLDQATAEAEALGGRWLEPGITRELEGFRWRCMADPEGNEFDIDEVPPR
jgi:predicted enzyme related to lactoylglutathione lyase